MTEAICIRSARDLNAPLTIFDVLKQDTEDVISLINYYIEKGNNSENVTQKNQQQKSEERIRVNDKTATGGWF